MEKITKLHPVFLTFEGWVSTEGDVTVPENTMGGCPKCWSPVVRVELSNNGVCVCCGWNDNLNKVIHSVEMMSMQIQYNTSKHRPSGAVSFLDYWKLARHMQVGSVITQGILSYNPEKPEWLVTIESMWLTERGNVEDNFNRVVVSQAAARSIRRDMLRQMGFLKHRLDDHNGMVVDPQKIFNPDIYQYQYPEQANTATQPAKLDGKKPSNEGEDK